MRWCLWLVVAACGRWEPPAAPDVVACSLDVGAEGVSPTAALAVELSGPPDVGSAGAQTVLVVRGAADERLLGHAERPPLALDEIERLAVGRVEVEGRVVRFVPMRPLAEGSLHTLVVTQKVRVAGWPLARTRLWPFTTGTEASGTAVARLVDPPDGVIDVVRNLREVAVRFSREVTGVDASSLRLEGDAGAVSAQVAPGECAGCFTILPLAPLEPDARYRVIAGAGIADETGAPPFAWGEPPGFTTGEALRTAAPVIARLAASPSSGCVVVRFGSDVPAAAWLRMDGAEAREAGWTTQHELALPLPGGAPASFFVTARDASTAPAATAGPLPVPDSSPRRLVITEVLTHPLGPWPAQQFVEVHNRGGAPETLAGLALHDEGGVNALPDIEVLPGGRALIVPSTYIPGDGDPAPAPGTVIARISSTRLGMSGLRQSGEEMVLSEADGRPVSRFSTYGLKLARGQSARRIAGCDVTGAYGATPGGTSTPGTD